MDGSSIMQRSSEVHYRDEPAPTPKGGALNRKELVDAIQKHTLVARSDVDKVLGSLIQHTQVAVKKGERVSLIGFGTFERQDRKARTARNPRTGAPVKVKATKVPQFRAGQGFKDVVAGKAAPPKLTPARSTAKAATTARATVSRASTAKASASKAKASGRPLPGTPSIPPKKPPKKSGKSTQVTKASSSRSRSSRA
jgi:DNA-binding protein HU-beta